jgi:hypothetical protein
VPTAPRLVQPRWPLWLTTLALAAAALARFCPPGLASGPGLDQGALWSEGALGSDLLLAIDADAQSSLINGDRDLARSRLATGEEAARLARQAFETWLKQPSDRGTDPLVEWTDLALAWGAAGAQAEGPASAVPARASEALSVALLRRLNSLTPGELSLWSAQFEGAAEGALRQALANLDNEAAVEASLRALERELPGTAAATRAALLLCDRELERGAPIVARSWARRALASAALLNHPEGQAAAQRRLEALRGSFERHHASAAAELPFTPTGLGPGKRVELGSAGVPDVGFRSGALGLLPGGAPLGAGRLLVQGLQSLVVIDLAAGRLETSIDPAEVLKPLCGAPSFPFPSPSQPPWRLLPATHGGSNVNDFVAVLGRSRVGDPGNQLARLSLPASSGVAAVERPTLPLAWVWCRGALRMPGSEAGLDQLPTALKEGEFGAAPLWLGERLVASLRRTVAEGEAWIAGFDARQGRLRFATLLAQGSLRATDARRLAGSSAMALAQPPLWAGDGTAMIDTGLGAVALIDVADGRLLYCLRLRRSPETEAGAGWIGERSLFIPGQPATGGDGSDRGQWLVAPADSDRLYRLPDGALSQPAAAGAAPLEAPWERRGERGLLWSDGRRALLLGQSGNRATLIELELASGARRSVLQFSPGERVSTWPLALADGQRLLVASDSALYLFDCSLVGAPLLAAQALETRDDGSGRGPDCQASLVQVGDRVALIEGQAVHIFELR